MMLDMNPLEEAIDRSLYSAHTRAVMSDPSSPAQIVARFLSALNAEGYTVTSIEDHSEAVDAEPLSVNQEADKIINGVRREDYGPVRESFKVIADGWALIRQGDLSPEEEVAACMIWMKVARSLTGTPHRDSQVDIAGYAGLWAQLAGGQP